MVQFNLGHVVTNKITNEIKINLEKDPHKEPYIHQAQCVMDAKQALDLIDKLRVAVKSLTEKD